MSKHIEILTHLIGEREAALHRVRIITEVIDIVQRDGLSKDNLDQLEAFLENSSKGNVKKVVTMASKMNAHADLTNKYAGYNEAKSIKDKVVVILENERRFLHVKEIAEILLRLDFGNSRKIEDYIKNLSPVLSAMAKNGDRIMKVSTEGNKKSTI